MSKKIFLLFSFLVTLMLFNSLVLAKDLNDDGVVDILDLVIVANAFRSKLGDPSWNDEADLDDDGKVDIHDLTLVANKLGTETTTKSKLSGISSIFPLSLSDIFSWFKNLFIKPAEESPPTTKLFLDPKEIIDPSLEVDETFTIDINVDDVIDLGGWQVFLRYNDNVLEFTDVVFSDFLGETFSVIIPPENLPHDIIGLVATIYPPYSEGDGKSGSGTLATITFTVIGEGESDLEFINEKPYEHILTNTTVVGTYVGTIEHEVEDGYFRNIQYLKIIPSSGTIIY